MKNVFRNILFLASLSMSLTVSAMDKTALNDASAKVEQGLKEGLVEVIVVQSQVEAVSKIDLAEQFNHSGLKLTLREAGRVQARTDIKKQLFTLSIDALTTIN